MTIFKIDDQLLEEISEEEIKTQIRRFKVLETAFDVFMKKFQQEPKIIDLSTQFEQLKILLSVGFLKNITRLQAVENACRQQIDLLIARLILSIPTSPQDLSEMTDEQLSRLIPWQIPLTSNQIVILPLKSLEKIFKDLLARTNAEKVIETITWKETSKFNLKLPFQEPLEVKISELKNKIGSKICQIYDYDFLHRFMRAPTRREIILNFLALLDLISQGFIVLHHHKKDFSSEEK